MINALLYVPSVGSKCFGQSHIVLLSGHFSLGLNKPCTIINNALLISVEARTISSTNGY